MKRPKIKDYKKEGETFYHKVTKQNFEFDISKYINLVKSNYESKNKELIERLIIEVTKEADRLYPNPHGADIRKAIAFVSGGNYILNQLKT